MFTRMLALCVSASCVCARPDPPSPLAINPHEGTPVAHIFAFAGQSNATGGAHKNGFPIEYRDGVPGTEMCENSDNAVRDWDVVSPRPTDNRCGSEVAAVYHIVQACGNQNERPLWWNPARGDKILVLKYSRNGTGIDANWKPWLETHLYAEMREWMNERIETIEAAGWKVQLHTFSWIQGEGDGRVRNRAERYEENLRTLFGRIEDEIGFTTFILPKVNPVNAYIWDDATQQMVRRYPFAEIVSAERQAFLDDGTDGIEAVGFSVDNFTYQPDNTHLDAIGHAQCGAYQSLFMLYGVTLE